MAGEDGTAREKQQRAARKSGNPNGRVEGGIGGFEAREGGEGEGDESAESEDRAGGEEGTIFFSFLLFQLPFFCSIISCVVTVFKWMDGWI